MGNVGLKPKLKLVPEYLHFAGRAIRALSAFLSASECERQEELMATIRLRFQQVWMLWLFFAAISSCRPRTLPRFSFPNKEY